MIKPRVFPGVNGCPEEDIPSFVCLDGLPPEWHHIVTLSRAIARALNAAAQIPLVEDEDAREALFHEMDTAEVASLDVVETIRRFRQWSHDNLEAAAKATAREEHAEASAHAHAHKTTPSPTHATKSHG
jgi:hypothetical protein